VLASLLGLGYYLHSSQEVSSRYHGSTMYQHAPRSPGGPPPSDRPTMSKLHESNHVPNIRAQEQHMANRLHQAASQPEKHADEGLVFSPLLGRPLSRAEFHHNNMVPFYGTSIKQNIASDANQPILETFVGAAPTTLPVRRKSEVVSMFQPQKDLAHVHGAVARTTALSGRIEAPRVRNNELPMPQVRVGPGITEGGQGGGKG